MIKVNLHMIIVQINENYFLVTGKGLVNMRTFSSLYYKLQVRCQRRQKINVAIPISIFLLQRCSLQKRCELLHNDIMYIKNISFYC